ncbi:MAG: amidohydrolase [candidate division Zixibacteria bacterium]|nr:amidohydrolase [candidate division Zixibacteria bacterium]
MTISNDKIIELAKKMHPTQIKWRRHFHQYPELSNLEFNTTAFIKKELKKRRIKILPLNMPTGLAAQIGNKGKTTAAIRTDIDALPVTEQNKIPFKSKIDGVMHACGHDMHIATVLGTTIILNKLKKELPGIVKILFQPAEEKPPGGAFEMLKAGVFKNPKIDMIFGLHVDTTLPTGKISLRDGPTMAAVIDFDIHIKGKGGHAARPHDTIDAIAVVSELVGSIQKIASREIDPMKPVVITFGKISGGTTRNVIADKAILHGTARTLSPDSLKRLPALIKRTANGICKARGASCRVDFIASYPVVNNSASTNKILAKSYTDLFGKNRITETEAVMGGEDFAYYLQKAPGAMFRLGTRNKKIGSVNPWHYPNFMADEESIFYGTSLLVKAVLDYLNKK